MFNSIFITSFCISTHFLSKQKAINNCWSLTLKLSSHEVALYDLKHLSRMNSKYCNTYLWEILKLFVPKWKKNSQELDFIGLHFDNQESEFLLFPLILRIIFKFL